MSRSGTCPRDACVLGSVKREASLGSFCLPVLPKGITLSASLPQWRGLSVAAAEPVCSFPSTEHQLVPYHPLLLLR